MLLLAFRPSGGAMTLADLCRATGIPKATAHRLVAELEKWGLLERSGRRLRLGMRLFELGQLVPRQRDIGEIAAPYLADPFEATRETVHLAIRDGLEVVYVQKLGRGAAAAGGARGWAVGCPCTAPGWARPCWRSTQRR